MKRSEFLKKLCVGVATAIVAPSVVADNLKSDNTNPNHILKEPFDIPESDLVEDGIQDYENGYKWYEYSEVETQRRFDEAYEKFCNKVEFDFWFKNG